MRRRLLIAAAMLVLVAVAIGVAYVLHVRQQSHDIRGSSTYEFVTTAELPPKPPPAPGIVWPTFKFGETRAGISPYAHRPPYRAAWQFRARSLIEFPPAIAFGRLYFANNAGVLFAVEAKTGKLAWRYRSGRVQASSPTVAGRTVFHTFLYRPGQKGDDRDGELIAFNADNGKIRWRRTLAPSESSPLVHRGRVYVGDWSGRVQAFDARTGRRLWTFATGGEVKGAIAASGGRLFVGSYDHHLYSLNARTGKQLWRASVQERLGPPGRFYAAPVVAYGRIYIGATDGRVYAYGATSGDLLWSHQTGGYVYSSPAVWHRLVLVGSYDKSFYALDAATGDIRWKFDAGSKISGSPTVMAGLVYFAAFAGRTYALDARTGKRAWLFKDGSYAAPVADKERMYQVGTGFVYAFTGRGPRGR